MQSWSPVLPPSDTAVWLVPCVLAYVSAAGLFSGWLRVRRGVADADTRKVFHFLIFTSAAALSLALGVGAVNVLGGVTALYVATVLRVGEGNLLYEAIARQADRPHRSLYVVLPFLATAAGGIASSFAFGAHAAVGYAASGWGDAAGEPVGTRWGRHRYPVPSLAGGRGSRSLEGSAAVWAASSIAAALVLGPGGLSPQAGALAIAGRAAAIGLACAVVEALSPRGLDNLTVQVAASGLSAAMV